MLSISVCSVNTITDSFNVKMEVKDIAHLNM